MPSTVEPRNSIEQGWALGESGWKAGMDANLKFLDNFGVYLSVLDRDLLTPPGSPANGATYIMPAGTLTGAWSARAAGDIAMYSTVDVGWRFKTPRLGYTCWVEDEAALAAYKGAGVWGVVGSGAIIDSIADSDTTNAPSRNAVFDALALKASLADVDARLAGLSWKQRVRAATTAAGTLATSFANGSIIDGVTLVTGDRILIKDQAAPAENGIYVVAVSGAPARATDADAGDELVNASCYVSEGTTNDDTQWTCATNAPITVDTTALTFEQLNTGGSGDVVGPASSTDSNTPEYDGVTGKLLKGGYPVSTFAKTQLDDANAAAGRVTLEIGVAAILAGVNSRLRMLPDVTHPLVRGIFVSTGTTRNYKNIELVVGTVGTLTGVSYAGMRFIKSATAATASSTFQQNVNTADLVTSGGAINGYLAWQQVYLPDASYGAGATGVNLAFGVSSNAAGVFLSTTLRIASGQVGAVFNFNTNLSDTNWQFSVRDGTDITTVDTGLAFTVQNTYVGFIHAPSGDTNTYYCIVNLTAGTAAYGSVARQHGSTACYQGCFGVTLDNVARSMATNDIWTLMGGAT